MLGLFAACSFLWSVGHLPPKWLFAGLGGLVFLCAALLSRNFERFLLGFIFFIIPLNLDFHFDIGPDLYTLGIPLGTPRIGISLIDICLVFLYPIWMVRLVTDREHERIFLPKASWFFIAFIAWSAVTMVNAPQKQLSLFLVLGLIKAFLCFFYLANHVRTREDLLFAARMFMSGLILESFLCSAQQAAGRNLGLAAFGEQQEAKEMELGAETVFRVGGTLGHPNLLGAYLASILPVSLSLMLTPEAKRNRAFAGFAFFMGSLALIFSYCRSAWLVMVPVVLGIGAWKAYQNRKSFNWKPLLTLGLPLMVIALAMGPMIAARVTSDDNGSTASRIPQWKVGMNMVKANPVFGVGINNYNMVTSRYEAYIQDEKTPTRVFIYEGRLHNALLSIAAETGLVGLAFFLAFIVSALCQGWKKFSAEYEPVTKSILIGITIGLAARILNDTVHTGNLATNMVVWIFAAILTSRIRIKVEKPEDREL